MKPSEVKTIPEHVQIECLARYGSVFAAPGRDAGDYWQLVWDWLKVAHRDLLEDPDVDYPNGYGPTKGDMALLKGIWQWQRRFRDE